MINYKTEGNNILIKITQRKFWNLFQSPTIILAQK